MDKFIIADPHLDHDNIRKLCNRPFNSIEEMNTAIITNWNNKVPSNGLIYILGDFMKANKTTEIKSMVNRLNGHKVLVYGNHDKLCHKTEPLGFQNKTHYIEDNIFDGKDFRKLCMFHYPILSWNKKIHGSWLAYGHSHGSMVNTMNAFSPGTWDVGVDVNDFTPLSFDELAKNILTTYPKK